MLYTDLKIGEKEFKLRLDARACVALEKKLGKSPLNVLMEAGKDSLPKLEDMIAIFHASIQKYQSGYTEEKTYDLYDEYVESGNALTDFIPVILEIFKVSGFFKEEDTQEKK